MKPYVTDDGMLLVEATCAKPGVLVYHTADGRERRELRLPEENEKAASKFGLVPVTNEHPNGLLTKDNADEHRKGLTLQNVSAKGGYVKTQIAIFDSVLHRQVLDGERIQISPGYTCKSDESPGVWVDPETGKSHRYDAIQRDLEINHVAVVKAGRAGEFQAIHVDSQGGDIAYTILQSAPTLHTDKKEKPRMATLRIDSAEYTEVPEVVASVVAAKLQRLDELDEAVPALEQDNDRLNEEITRLSARSDATEYVLGNAEEILENLGYVRTADGTYAYTGSDEDDEEDEGDRTDSKGKKPAFLMNKDEENEDDEEEGDEEEEKPMPPFMKKGKKDAKRKDSVKEVIAAFREADQLVPPNEEGKSFSDLHVDSLDSVSAIHQAVVEAIAPDRFPNFRLDGKSSDAIEVAYELIKSSAESAPPSRLRTDNATDYTDILGKAAAHARSRGSSSAAQKAQQEQSEKLSTAWQEPLELSRK